MSLILFTLLIIIAVALIVVYFQVFISFVDFFMVCSSEELSLRASMALWSVAKRNKKGHNAVELFEDTDFLNRCIMTLTQKKVVCSEGSKSWNFYADLLDILYEVRQKLSQKLNSSSAVSSSLDLPEDSALTLSAADVGGATYQSKVLSNNKSGMVISYPVGPKLPLNFSWRGKQVLVSVLVGGVSFRFAMTFDYNYWDQSFTTLRLLHSDSFSQEQRRSSVRYNVHVPALFTLLAPHNAKGAKALAETASAVATDESAATDADGVALSEVSMEGEDLLAGEPRDLRSVIKNLSLGGCQVLVGGKIPGDAECKLLLRLNGQEIPTQGITRLVRYVEADDFSYVRIQFTYIESEDLRKICSFIYGIEIERDEVPPTPQENSSYYSEEQGKNEFPEILNEEDPSNTEALAALRELRTESPTGTFGTGSQISASASASSSVLASAANGKIEAEAEANPASPMAGELQEELQGLLQNIYSGHGADGADGSQTAGAEAEQVDAADLAELDKAADASVPEDAIRKNKLGNKLGNKLDNKLDNKLGKDSMQEAELADTKL